MMNFNGMIKEIGRDFYSGKRTMLISMDSDDCLCELEQYQDRTVSVQIKLPSHGKSIKANAYAWVLMQLIAERIGSTKEEVYLEMLKKYSGVFITVWMREDAINDFVEKWRTVVVLDRTYRYHKVDGHRKRVYGHDIQCYFGLSTFDNNEMRVFVDGLVRECTELRISTIPGEELERMLKGWQGTQSS